jgi:hypothetical protein
MTISLAFLAPDLIQAAIDGRLPYGMGIARLTDFEDIAAGSFLCLKGAPRHSAPKIRLATMASNKRFDERQENLSSRRTVWWGWEGLEPQTKRLSAATFEH